MKSLHFKVKTQQPHVFKVKTTSFSPSFSTHVLGIGRHGTVHEQNQRGNPGTEPAVESCANASQEKDRAARGGELQRRGSLPADPDGRRGAGEHQAVGGKV